MFGIGFCLGFVRSVLRMLANNCFLTGLVTAVTNVEDDGVSSIKSWRMIDDRTLARKNGLSARLRSH